MLNCHILTPLIDDCFLTCEEVQVHRGEEMSFASIERKNLSREESERKQYGHKIDILFRIDDTEYFGSETQGHKNIIIHGINQGGLNGKIYAMYYDVDLQYYFAYETCRYASALRGWGSIPDSLATLKDILCLKRDITNVIDTVKRTKRISLRTNSKDLFTINNLPATTSSPKKHTERII
ncbi:unnamed protein product [Rhizophagus irregularis]|nr:unnamed protein product [Rhizophagus irregularis]